MVHPDVIPSVAPSVDLCTFGARGGGAALIDGRLSEDAWSHATSGCRATRAKCTAFAGSWQAIPSVQDDGSRESDLVSCATSSRGVLPQSSRRDRRADSIVFFLTTSRVRPATVSETTVRVAECDAARGSRITALLDSRDGALFVRPLEF